MENIDNLVVGCGFAGAVAAERLATLKGESVLIIDTRNHIAGNAYDYKDPDTGITVHKYGPHVFHTNSKTVFDYLSQFTEWHLFMYRVKAVIDGIEVNIPFNYDSIRLVFSPTKASRLEEKLEQNYPNTEKIFVSDLLNNKDDDLHFFGDYVYRKVFLGYTVKMWGLEPKDIDQSVINRVPIYLSRDNRYFQDKYQAIPANGYTELIKNIINNPLIKTELNTDYHSIKNKICAKRIIYTGSVDELYNYCEGALPYRSLKFDYKTLEVEYFQSGPQINYPENYDFTRICEYKYYLNEKSPKTIVSKEYPCAFEIGKNERFYPISNEKNNELYKKYLQLNNDGKFIFLGRLGLYKYMNMDQTVLNVLDSFTNNQI